MEQDLSIAAFTPPPAINMQEITREANSYSKIQKGAIIIALLGAEHAGPIVKALDDRHMCSFVAALQSIKFIARPVLLATIAEFITSLRENSNGLQGGETQARELAEALLSTERAKRIFQGASDSRSDNVLPAWDRLKKETPALLAEYLNTQRPELVSLVLTKLGTLSAGELLAELSDDIAEAAASHMSEGTKFGSDVETAAFELLRIEFLEKEPEDDGTLIAGFMADVMGVLPKARRERLMDTIAKSNPATAEKIRKGLLTFEDLPKRLPKTAVPVIFRDMEAGDLLAALQAGGEAAPETAEFLYANISQRMAKQFKEQVEELGRQSEKDADSAIIGLMSFISKAEKSGAIAYIDVEETEE